MLEVTDQQSISPRDLLVVIRRSGLVSDEDLNKALRDVDFSALSGNELAARLIDAQLISVWQARQLLKARWRGYRLGKYMLLDELGRGGMAKVFLARHEALHSFAAIKVLTQARTQKASMVERFLREARAAAQLSHPNIVRVFDVDTDEGRHYLIMEYVNGPSVQGLVDGQGVLSYEQAARFARQAAEGLACAHKAGMIHRDIKPANLLVTEGELVKVSDFGLALVGVGEAEDGPSLTMQHDERVLGTADYIAPEQAINSHAVDPRADLYSLGHTLYFMLTGQPPFPTGRIVERLTKHCTAEPEDIRKFRPDAPEGLRQIFHRLTRKKAGERYDSAEAAAAALAQWLRTRDVGGSTLAEPHPAGSGGHGDTSISRSGAAGTLSEASMVMKIPIPSNDDEPLGLAPEEDAAASVAAKSTSPADDSSSPPTGKSSIFQGQAVPAASLLADLLDDLPEENALAAGSSSATHGDWQMATDSGDPAGSGGPLAAPASMADTNASRAMITAAEEALAEARRTQTPWAARMYQRFKRGEYPLWLLIGAGLILGAILLFVGYSYTASFISAPPVERLGE